MIFWRLRVSLSLSLVEILPPLIIFAVMAFFLIQSTTVASIFPPTDRCQRWWWRLRRAHLSCDCHHSVDARFHRLCIRIYIYEASCQCPERAVSVVVPNNECCYKHRAQRLGVTFLRGAAAYSGFSVLCGCTFRGFFIRRQTRYALGSEFSRLDAYSVGAFSRIFITIKISEV